MNIDEKIENAKNLKEEGNAAFKAGDLKNAMRCYHEIMLHVRGLDWMGMDSLTGGTGGPAKVSDDQKAAITALQQCHHLNLAAIYVKTGKFSKGEAACTEALKVSPENQKGLFRRGKCRSELGDLDGAKEDLEKALQLDPNDGQVKRELKVLEHKFRKHEAKERKSFAGMFDKE
eukprot:CAMPEP_0196586418 /NCGR_PEP_ID=MMETSP1081-20130531/54202_1 /TAXON_ID=36882 /ORGANISM="Pyramimonas amylifera, Strain CCMP720" /LENGTH=173 /DNA_ID=CAMNT_0041908291 /DNA_START=21 /DNA_END=542 /DNA_ORIENTATION=-